MRIKWVKLTNFPIVFVKISTLIRNWNFFDNPTLNVQVIEDYCKAYTKRLVKNDLANLFFYNKKVCISLFIIYTLLAYYFYIIVR